MRLPRFRIVLLELFAGLSLDIFSMSETNCKNSDVLVGHWEKKRVRHSDNSPVILSGFTLWAIEDIMMFIGQSDIPDITNRHKLNHLKNSFRYRSLFVQPVSLGLSQFYYWIFTIYNQIEPVQSTLRYKLGLWLAHIRSACFGLAESAMLQAPIWNLIWYISDRVSNIDQHQHTCRWKL